jgi:hypothetical protein
MQFFFYSFYRLGPVAYSNSELTSETMNPIRHFVGLLEWEISPSQGLYIHRTMQHKNPTNDIHTSSVI